MIKTFSFILVLSLFSTFALAQSKKEKTEAAEKKAAEERQRSLGGARTENELKDDKGQVSPAKSSGEENTGGDQQQNQNQTNSQPGTAASSGSDTAAQATNTPAVIQPSTSESGSPSIMSENNGQGRDGTGNVQRAKPNIAGAEIPGDMNMDEKNTKKTSDNPATSKIREEEETPAQITNSGTQDVRPVANQNTTSKEPDNKSARDRRKRKRDKN